MLIGFIVSQVYRGRRPVIFANRVQRFRVLIAAQILGKYLRLRRSWRFQLSANVLLQEEGRVGGYQLLR